MPIVSLPELETWIETWAFSETIHSRSYTHIIRNVYSDPSKVFDEMMDMKEIVDVQILLLNTMMISLTLVIQFIR